MRILFFTSNEPDYLSDGLLHGLRSLLGAQVVDFPKNDAMYRSYPEERAGALYGRGFSLYRTLEDVPTDRFYVFRDLKEGRFDLVVFSDIWRQTGFFVETMPWLSRAPRVAILDGADTPVPYPYSSVMLRVPGWWIHGLRDRHSVYFKRELIPEVLIKEQPVSRAPLYHRLVRLLPSSLCRALPIRRFRPIAFSFPEEKIVSAPPRKLKQFPAHIVDSEVAAVVGGQPTYAFANEAEYYADLQASRFGVTCKRAGWDCMRHYEIAANGAVVCFRNLKDKPVTCAPHGLTEYNSISYEDASDLLERVSRLTEDEYARLLRGAMIWAKSNTTVARARQFLRDMRVGGYAM